jgi:predicted nucleic acid-binding protein
MKLFLDTSIIIDYTRQSDNPDSPLAQLSKKYDAFYISDITLSELYSGHYIWKSKEKMKKLKLLLRNITTIPTSEKIAIRAGQIRAKSGIALLDCLIASTAIANKLPLATLNIKDFTSIPHLKVIKL